MSKSKALRHLTLVFVLTLILGCKDNNASSQGNQDDRRSAGQEKQSSPPKRLPQPIVEAWTKAGAKAGWFRRDDLGNLRFHPDSETPKPGDVPGFVMDSWKDMPWREGIIEKLPTPPDPFGLDVSSLSQVIPDAAV